MIVQELDGSSTVTMCSGLVRLMMSTNDAKVVDFPEPVGPVTAPGRAAGR